MRHENDQNDLFAALFEAANQAEVTHSKFPEALQVPAVGNQPLACVIDPMQVLERSLDAYAIRMTECGQIFDGG